MTGKARMAETACLTSIGFHALHNVGWEWDVFDTICKRYQLHNSPGWDPDAQARSEGTVVTAGLFSEPQATAASAVGGRGSATAAAAPPRVHKCGKHLATHFLMDACAPPPLLRPWPACRVDAPTPHQLRSAGKRMQSGDEQCALLFLADDDRAGGSQVGL